MKPYNDKESKGDQVRRMFDRIAPRYDLLNHLLSLGIDRGWRRRAVREIKRAEPVAVLDVASGTGDMAFAVARALPKARVTGVDLSAGMVAVGQGKALQNRLSERVSIEVGDVSNLRFADGEFDAVCVAFGVRNFEDIGRGMAEMARVLRSGGMVAILEFSTPDRKLFAALYRFYFHHVLPTIGGWISGDRNAYRYLPSSVDEFPSPENFLEIMRRAGFSQVSAAPLTGGAACLYVGKRPDYK